MKNPPADVIWVIYIAKSGIPVGSGTIQRINEIVDKYPEWFPWEHKYKAIPQSVHDAFEAEAYPQTPISFTNDDNSKGLFAMLDEPSIPTLALDKNKQQTIDEYLWETFKLTAKAMEQKLKVERIEKNRVRNIWKKHYDKYGLRFNPNNYLT